MPFAAWPHLQEILFNEWNDAVTHSKQVSVLSEDWMLAILCLLFSLKVYVLFAWIGLFMMGGFRFALASPKHTQTEQQMAWADLKTLGINM